MQHPLSPEEAQDLYENAPCGYHSVDAEGRIVRINDTALEWLGFAREEIVGRMHFSELLAPGSRERFERGFPAFLERGHARDVELELLCKDGATIPVLLNATALRDPSGAFVASRTVLVNLSERKRAEEQLSRFFSLSLDMLCIADFDGYFREVNQAWEKTLGHSVAELTARPFLEFVHPDDREMTLAEAGRLAKGCETISFENRYRCADGSYKWLHWSAAASLDQRLIYAVARDVTDRKHLEEALRHAAAHDPLTGLPNRSLVMNHLGRLFERAKRAEHYALAVLYIDLDDFKPINDMLGHAVGDEVLVEVSRRLERSVRPGDLLGRFGGDEFVAVLTDVGGQAEAVGVAERIARELSAPIDLGGRAVSTTASIGVAMYGPGHDRALDLLREADVTMYRAKALGKGHCALARRS